MKRESGCGSKISDEDIAASFQEAATEVLASKLITACENENINRVVLAPTLKQETEQGNICAQISGKQGKNKPAQRQGHTAKIHHGIDNPTQADEVKSHAADKTAKKRPQGFLTVDSV